MHDVGVAEHHALLLLTEWAEDVLHQSPAQEGSVFVDPFHFEIGEVAHFSQWGFCGSDEALILIEIDEDIQLVADASVFRNVAGWKEDFSLISTIEIQTEIYFLYDAKAIVSRRVLSFLPYHIIFENIKCFCPYRATGLRP